MPWCAKSLFINFFLLLLSFYPFFSFLQADYCLTPFSLFKPDFFFTLYRSSNIYLYAI